MDGPRFGRHALVTGTVLTVIGLFGCSRQTPPRTTGQEVDAAIEKSKDTMEDVEQYAGEAARATGMAINDAAITAAVTAKLAPDPDLKTLDVSVQTTAGRTLLQGTAPNAASRDRAARLAGAVGGVTAVDKQLTVQPCA